jgi:hypothetical protein
MKWRKRKIKPTMNQCNKSWSFEKINKIDKLLENLKKMRMKDPN